jgi:hypothetical protein
MSINYRYLVWDPLNELEAQGKYYSSSSALRAAELHAENDLKGQADGVYTEAGHLLHVRDGVGQVHDVMVCIEHTTHYEARSWRAAK